VAFGPLAGLKVVEMGAIGPVPFAAGFLADMGAEVIRLESPTPGLALPDGDEAIHLRGRDSVQLNLRDSEDLKTARMLIDRADLLLEGFRPGTMERLGLDPADLTQSNPGLIVGRMTGWGQSGPMADRAGHDINYIAMSGPLRHTARQGEAPVPAVNLLGDFGGGAMFLIAGILAALYERERSGKGQIIDAAMVDGSAYLMMLVYSLRAQGMWREEAGTNLLDTGAPFYDVYRTSDGEYLSVGCLEPKFYAQFLAGLELDPKSIPDQHDVTGWPQLRQTFADSISAQSRDHWDEVFSGTDACVMGARSLTEAAEHPHMVAREVFLGVDTEAAERAAGDPPLQPAPAPRFSRTPGKAVPRGDRLHGEAALQKWGIGPRQ
jgi:alpha-methylacyl-CoA racemase